MNTQPNVVCADRQYKVWDRDKVTVEMIQEGDIRIFGLIPGTNLYSTEFKWGTFKLGTKRLARVERERKIVNGFASEHIGDENVQALVTELDQYIEKAKSRGYQYTIVKMWHTEYACLIDWYPLYYRAELYSITENRYIRMWYSGTKWCRDGLVVRKDNKK